MILFIARCFIIMFNVVAILNKVFLTHRIRKEFTKEINKVKPSMKSIPFISVYNLTERTERSFSKIKLFASDISLLTFVVFPIAEEVKV